MGAIQRAHVDMALACYKGSSTCPACNVGKGLRRRPVPRYRSHRKGGVRSHPVSSAAITPWNVPLYVNVGRSCPPCGGCTVILKPHRTPPALARSRRARIRGGISSRVLNVVTGADPAMAGEMLVTDHESI